MVDRGLGDVRRVARGAAEAVHDRRESQELLPFLGGDVVREGVDELLMGRAGVHGLVRRLDVRRDERGEGLVEFNRTRDLFEKPKEELTENYITGRFG